MQAINKDSHTNFAGARTFWFTLISLLIRYKTRRGITRSSRTRGRIDRMVSSNKRVKSNPPRQLPAYGPNVSSTRGHGPDDFIFACGMTTQARDMKFERPQSGHGTSNRFRSWSRHSGTVSLLSRMRVLCPARCMYLQKIQLRVLPWGEKKCMAPEYMTRPCGLGC